MYLEIITAIIDQQFQITYNANGVHSFKFFTYKNSIISIEDALKLNSKGIKIPYHIHAGIKYRISDDIAIFSLFTSQEITTLPFNIKINNIKLNENIHQYMNPLSLIDNNIFSKFFIVSDNINNFPHHCQIYSENTDKIIYDSVEAYKNALIQYNFNNSYIAISEYLSYYKIPSNIQIKNILYFSRDPSILRLKGVKNNDIINFFNSFNMNKTSLGVNLYDNNIYNNKFEKWSY